MWRNVHNLILGKIKHVYGIKSVIINHILLIHSIYNIYYVVVCILMHVYFCLFFSHWVVSNSLWPHGLYSTSLPKIGVSFHFLLQGRFLTQGLNPGLLHYRQMLYRWATWEAYTCVLPMCKRKVIVVAYMLSCSIMSNFLWPQGL